jgi:WD40 repeat protein
MNHSGNDSRIDPGVEDREDRNPLFSMRTKTIVIGAIFLGGMILIATPGIPYLALAIQEILYGVDNSQNPIVIGYGWLLGAEMSPTGNMLATMSESAIHIWSANGTLLSTLYASQGVPWAGFGWSPDGNRISALDYLGNLTIASVPSLSVNSRWRKKPIYELAIMSADIWRINTWPVKWSPNSSLVAFGYCDARTHLLDVSSHKHIELPNPRSKFDWIDVRTIDWDPSGNHFIKAARKSFVVYDTLTLEAIYEIGKEEY